LHGGIVGAADLMLLQLSEEQSAALVCEKGGRKFVAVKESAIACEESLYVEQPYCAALGAKIPNCGTINDKGPLSTADLHRVGQTRIDSWCCGLGCLWLELERCSVSKPSACAIDQTRIDSWCGLAV